MKHASRLQTLGLTIMENGSPGIVTEYLPGTLLDLLEGHARQRRLSNNRSNSVVPYDTICDIGRQLISVLSYLHDRNVRFLPANLHEFITQGWHTPFSSLHSSAPRVLSRAGLHRLPAHAMQCMHRSCDDLMQILHRDIKPENVLLSPSSDVRLCDFGFAKAVTCARDLAHLTPYVATRWYRAPEMLVGDPYNGKVDIWALGMLSVARVPLFASACTFNAMLSCYF